jgi:glutamate-1-semialdehyde 2,1-aminomutase
MCNDPLNPVNIHRLQHVFGVSMTPADRILEDARAHAAAAAEVLDHEACYALAEASLPGGALGGYGLPDDVRFVIRGAGGSRIEDVRGRSYIDYVCGAGALIIGHAHPAVTAAVTAQAKKGLHYFGTLNEACIRLAGELVDAIPCAGKIAFATTGSEATFYALRLARAFTGRNKILKCEGGYHGNHDYSSFSVSPQNLSNYPRGQPDTAGIPESLSESVLVAPYNDLGTMRRIIEAERKDLAAVIVEPVQRIIFPRDDFLTGLRRLCDENGVLLIFDEVVTGFRLAYGGAQEYFGVVPDLASYGKIVGGGGPVACVAGRSEIIELANPANRGSGRYVLINGTLHGNPLGSVAGLATLAELRKPGFHDSLHRLADDWRKACNEVLRRHRLPALALGAGSLWQIMFTDKPPSSHADVIASDISRARELDMGLLRNGIYVLPTVRRFISAVHTGQDLEDTVRALDAACHALR